MMADGILATILADTRRRLDTRMAAVTFRELAAQVEQLSISASPPPSLHSALMRPGSCDVALIAEYKRSSPSKGEIRSDLSVEDVAGMYTKAGATAISVLTEVSYFGGGLDFLSRARSATILPLLMKDFVVDEYQLMEGRLRGASAALLIAAAISPTRLEQLIGFAGGLGLDALVEVRNSEELDIALSAGASIVGVNNRDLRSFIVDLETAESLAQHIPADVCRVAESGIQTADDLRRMGAAGYHAVLVGEALMKSARPESAAQELADAGAGARGRGPVLKVCGLTQPENALACAQAGASILGIVFAPSPRQITQAQARKIMEALAPGFQRFVGVFVDEHPAVVAQTAFELGLWAVQLHGSEPPAMCCELSQTTRVIKAFRIGAEADSGYVDELIGRMDSYAELLPPYPIFLLDTLSVEAMGGTGRRFDWSIPRAINTRRPSWRLIVAGGIDPANVREAIAIADPWGLDVSSGVEFSPGLKDPAQVASLIRNQERAC